MYHIKNMPSCKWKFLLSLQLQSMSNRQADLGQSLGTGQGMTSSLVADAAGKREGEGRCQRVSALSTATVNAVRSRGVFIRS